MRFNDAAWLFPLAGPALLAPLGVALMAAGLGRGRHVTHTLLTALAAWGAAALGYALIGFHLAGYPGSPALVFRLHGTAWNYLAWVWRVPEQFLLPAYAWRLFGLLAAGWMAVVISAGALERWKLSRTVLAAFIFGALLAPLPLHWLWNGGWLAMLGQNFGLGHGAMDLGETTAIQACGGAGALALAWQVGARRHKFNSQGEPNALPGHSTVLMLTGCGLTLAGWLAWNAISALMVAHISPWLLARTEINTLLAAICAFLCALLLGRWRFGRPDASIAVNAWLGGLVASSAAAPFLSLPANLLTASAAGAIVFFSIPWLEQKLRLDDPAGVIPAHLLAGIWGLLAAGLFARLWFYWPAGSPRFLMQGVVPSFHGVPLPIFPSWGQWAAQIVVVVTLLGCLLPLAYAVIWLIERLWPGRVTPEAEARGLDLYELGSSAYPEMVTHGDEFL